MATFLTNFNIEKLIWLVALILGIALLISGLIYLLIKKGRRDIHYAKAAFMELLACWFLYIPDEIFNHMETCPNTILKWTEGILTALLRSFNIYSGGGYERAVYAFHPLFSSVYGIVRVLVNIALWLFVGGFILKFLNGPLQSLKLSFKSKHYFYVFPNCNEKSLTIARSIKAQTKQTIVFASGDDDISVKAKESIDSIGGIYVNDSLSNIIKKYADTVKGMEIFLFGDNDEGNVAKLESICEQLQSITKHNLIKIMVELSKTPWDLYDDYIKKHNLNDEDVIINFIRTEETFVYSNLLKNSIFKNAVKEKDKQVIKALIIGEMNARNIEMFKALLHLSQMPGYFLELTVIDCDCGRQKLWQMMPEIADDGYGDGDSLYHLNYVENIDYSSIAFEKAIEEHCHRFSFAFVNAGDDLLNINLALQLQALVNRSGWTYDKYLLQVNISKREIYEHWNSKLCEHLRPVGDLKQTYSYEFITNSDIEKAAKKIHEARHTSTKWNSYLNNEYNRHSVFARTLSYKYKIAILEELGKDYNLAGSSQEPKWSSKEELETIWNNFSKESKVWKAYEHMRWNVYTRTLGYQRDVNGLLNELLNENETLLYEIKKKKQLKEAYETIQKQKDEVWSKVKAIRSAAKIHNDLVPFEQLPLADKIKDNLELPPEVIEVLKQI